MSLCVFPYPSFDALIRGWLEKDAAEIGLCPRVVVVPSLAFADRLQLGIAEARGICMGYEFLMPQGFIMRVAERERGMFWSKEHLSWAIFSQVKNFSSQVGMGEDATPRDLWAVSSLMADMLEQYAHYRPELIRAWAKGKSGLGPSASKDVLENEMWQRELWKSLRDTTDEEHPAVAMENWKDNEKFLERVRKEFSRVTVLGSGAIDPLLVEVLGILNKAGVEVQVHVILPTMGYLADLKNRRDILDVASETPEEFVDEATHPLLSAMGRHAVGSFLLLGQLDENYSEWPEVDTGNSDSKTGTVLRRLQQDIREMKSSQGVAEDDGSIRIHSCFGARREMEVLRDEILRAFKEIEGLQPADIHIVTPSLQNYGALVQEVIGRMAQVSNDEGAVLSEALLQVHVTELPSAGQDKAVAALLALLEMARDGNFTASDVLDLLQLQLVQKALGIDEEGRELERVRQWIVASGVTRGLGTSKEKPEIGSWRFGRDRLLAGFWLGNRGSGKYPNQDFTLEVGNELSGDDELLGRFLHWNAQLEETFHAWNIAATPKEWTLRLRKALHVVLGCEDGGDLRVRPHLMFLEEVACEEAVDAGVMFDWLAEAAAEAKRRAGQSGKITMGQFRQLHNLPCKVLAMVGMEDGTFPRRERSPGWSLIKATPKMWDRNAGTDDRQMFLDAVLAPSERLIITGSTRNVRTNEDEPFSACVDELLRVLGEMGVRREKVLYLHPLTPFSEDYFSGNKQRRSFSAGNLAVAHGIAQRGLSRKPHPFYLGKNEVSPPPFIEISLEDLIRFWKEPAKGYLTAQGISLWREDGNDEALDDAPMPPLGPLAEWKLKDEVVRSVLQNGKDWKHLRARLEADRHLPKACMGDALLSPHGDGGVIRDLADNICTLRGDAWDLVFEFDLKGAPYGLTPMRVKVAGKVWKTAANTHLLAYHFQKAGKPKHFMTAWIEGVFASAAGKTLPTRFLSLSESGGIDEVNFPAADASHAHALVAGYVIGQMRPLGYASLTSEVIAKQLRKGESLENALRAAHDSWSKNAFSWTSASEGETEAAKFAWRDRDAFRNQEDWNLWAKAIATPLMDWRASK